MATPITREFLEQIPKTDLHLHLDGSLRVNTLIELAKAAKVPLPSETEAGLNEQVFKEKYQDLPDYLRGFGLTCAVLQTAENLERVAYELAQDSIAENVRYIEVRYAPQLHIHPGLAMEEVVESVNRGLERAQKEHNGSAAVKQGADIPFHYGIITCAMRFFNRHMSAYYAQLFDVMPHAPPRKSCPSPPSKWPAPPPPSPTTRASPSSASTSPAPRRASPPSTTATPISTPTSIS
jgi:adenosine deaminase